MGQQPVRVGRRVHRGQNVSRRGQASQWSLDVSAVKCQQLTHLSAVQGFSCKSGLANITHRGRGAWGRLFVSRSWRDRARPIIAAVIARVGTEDRTQLRKSLRDAFPFGPRQYHPYKIWLHEIRVQLGESPAPGTRRTQQAEQPSPGQMDLFGSSSGDQ